MGGPPKDKPKLPHLIAGKVDDEQYEFMVKEATGDDPRRGKPNFAPLIREAIDLLMEKRKREKGTEGK